MTYCAEFRRHVLAVRDEECLTFAETAERFSVGIASLTRWAKDPEPKAFREGRPRKVDLERLARDVAERPDDYQYERAVRFGVSTTAIWRGLRKLALTHKKRLRHPKADEVLRQEFQARIAEYEADGKPVVYLDESGFALDMPRTHGYAPRGQRCFGTHNWHARGRVNALGALLRGVLLTVSLTTSNVDTDIFNLWLEGDLLPKLPPGAVVVLDNASFHRHPDTRTIVEKAGHVLEYLPPYSPDLNPIEPKWAQAKAIRRKTGQTPDQIFEALF